MNKRTEDILKETKDLIEFSKGLEDSAKKVGAACNNINNSWSGSDLIGHANLFYGDFEIPPTGRRFSIEWGLVRGIPTGWNERNSEEVKERIEADSLVKIDEIDKQADEIVNNFEEIKKKAILLFAEVSREYANIIENFNLKTKLKYFNEYWKRQITTRDSEAIHAGRQVPDHKYYGAAASFIQDVSSQLREFLHLVEKTSIETKKVDSEMKAGDVKTFSYIDKKTLLRISKIENEYYDLSRLISLCKELDDNFGLENYYSCSMIIRAILDHIPPIFGKKSFTEVTAQHGSKSFKDLMKPLEDTARKIGDNYLHTQIGPKVLLISKTQIHFQSNIDILLNEIANILEK